MPAAPPKPLHPPRCRAASPRFSLPGLRPATPGRARPAHQQPAHLLAQITGLILLGTCQASAASASTLKLWVADAMTRVSRTEPVRPQFSAALTAARGEWESFQVVVTGPAAKVKGLKVEASPLKGPGTDMIPPATVLRAHYVTVSKSTPGAALQPGDYPDALVPQEFPWQELKGDTVNQPFWVDIFVPYPTPPGTYSGAVTLGDSTITVPITLEVLAFDMPVVPRLRTSFKASWRQIAQRHGHDVNSGRPTAAAAKIIDAYYHLLARHRLSVTDSYATYPAQGGKLDAAKVEAAMRKHLLHGHVANLALPVSKSFPFADPLGKDRLSAQSYVTQWMKLLAKIRCEGRGYATIAELASPSSAAAYADVRRWGEFFNEVEHRSGMRIPFLVMEQPTPDDGWWGRLDSTVDIWAPDFMEVWRDLESPDAQRDIARRLKAGDEVWTCAPPLRTIVSAAPPSARAGSDDKPAWKTHPPVWAMDYAPMNHRVLAWLLPLHGITGIAAWDTLFAIPSANVWADAGNYEAGAATYNGDGSFIYSATRKRHGADMPIASIRLKWLRELAEDYDYLMLARDAGIETKALKLGATFARGFGDWEADAEKLTSARLKLGELIAARTKLVQIRPAEPVEPAASAQPSPPVPTPPAAKAPAARPMAKPASASTAAPSAGSAPPKAEVVTETTRKAVPVDPQPAPAPSKGKGSR